MKYKVIAPLALIFLCACSALKQAPVTQGVAGYIYLKTGNQMPSPGRPISKGRGVARDVFFYKPSTARDLEGSLPLFSAVRSQLMARTRSDSTGAYQIKLPAGVYSVLVKEDGKFFGAITDGNGVINPLTVSPNAVTQFNLTITANASF